MKFLIFSSFLYIFLSTAFAEDFMKSVVLDPSISKRCEALIKKRSKKTSYKRKLESLLQRNKRLIKITPIAKVSVKRKLKKTARNIQQNLILSRKAIDRLEENIVRQGCPGLRL